VDQLEQDLDRFKQPAMVAVGGIAAALVIATLPTVYLEKVIGFTGISEFIGAAAPPLGNTAKGLIAVVAGIISASVIYVFLNYKGGSDMSLAIRRNLTPDETEAKNSAKANAGTSKFSLKRLLRKPGKNRKSGDGKVMDLSDLPQLRGADSHPDAPARRPIFADSDLGAPLAGKIKPFEQQVAEPVVAAPEPAVATPEVAPAPFVAEKSLRMEPVAQPEMAPSPMVVSAPTAAAVPPASLAPTAVAEPMVAPSVMPSVSVTPPAYVEPEGSSEDLSNLSLGELTDRLEAGLSRLKQLEFASRVVAQQPVVAPSSPAADQAPVGLTVSNEEAPVAVPPMKSVEKTEEQIQATRQADMDAALKAALGTLERMTAHR
jgi:hypothetical protein